MKNPKVKVLRARVTAADKENVKWAANVESLDEADIIRRSCADYVLKLKAKHQPFAHAA